MIAIRRLPGIRFETVTPQLAEPLPRMDIAVFVGFAACGPLQWPVAVESYADFSEVFGEDLPLVWDAERSAMETAFLAPAVRAFFANGGRRCWIVRVTGSQPESASFELPGLWTPGGSPLGFVAAVAQARSGGSWADGVQVSTALSSRGLASFPQAGGTSLSVVMTRPGEIAAGDLLRISYPGEVVLGVVSTLAHGAVELRDMIAAPAAAKDDASEWIEIAALPAGTPLLERLSFEILVRDGSGRLFRMVDFAFDAAHPRFWGSLPTDEVLFRPITPSPFAQSVVNPRFPLAGAATVQSPCYPIGMSMLPGSPTGRIETFRPPLERDGLADYRADMFLDPKLRATSARTMVDTADYLQYGSRERYDLEGIHLALRIDEATLIAAPDAAHHGWDPAPPVPLPQPAASKPIIRPEWWTFRDCWSQDQLPATSEPEWRQFLGCGIRITPRPVLLPVRPQTVPNAFKLEWTEVEGEGIRYSLEESSSPDFAGVTTIYEGSQLSFSFTSHAVGDWFYRVRAFTPTDTSDYSDGQAVRVQRGAGYTRREKADPFLQRAVHSSLLRLCAARGDLFALLSLPSGLRVPQATRYISDLRFDLRTEEECLSYGAVYYPWLFSRDAAGPLEFGPPDGALAGSYAARALARGAWIAPANRDLRNVIALDPSVELSEWQSLQDSSINTVREVAGRHISQNEDTLSLEEDVRPVHVRRLLQLIRRLALRLGSTYVFEPNDDLLSRAVERSFGSALGQMFQRGAFAGRTDTESYFVRMPEGSTLERARERGQLLIEIGVAPAEAMTFLTVRLLQTSSGAVVAVEG